MANFDEPAASRYAATNLTLLKWFARYNESVEPHDRVQPFNFLLSFQAKSPMEMAAVDPEALQTPMWNRRSPSPASRYSSDLMNDRPLVFDRDNGQPVPWHWLKSYRRALVRHHLHAEMKFQGGEAEQRGVLRRRHIAAWAIIPIGKEADNLEEREAIGGEDDPVHWSMAKHDRARIAADIEMILKARRISDRSLCSRAGVSHHTLADLRASCRVTEHSLLSLAQAAEELRLEAESIEATQERWRSTAEQLALEIGGVSKLASRIGVTRQYLNRVLTGKKAMTPRLEQSIEIMARAEAGFLAAETG